MVVPSKPFDKAVSLEKENRIVQQWHHHQSARYPFFVLLTYLTGPHPSTSAVLVQDERSQEALKTSFPSLFAFLSDCILALTNL